MRSAYHWLACWPAHGLVCGLLTIDSLVDPHMGWYAVCLPLTRLLTRTWVGMRFAYHWLACWLAVRHSLGCQSETEVVLKYIILKVVKYAEITWYLIQIYSQSNLPTPWCENRKIRHENEILKANNCTSRNFRFIECNQKNIPQNLVILLNGLLTIRIRDTGLPIYSKYT
jgi:hypothetical protein